MSNFQAKELQSPVKKFSLDMEKVKQFDAMVDDAAAEVVEISLNNSGGARYSTLIYKIITDYKYQLISVSIRSTKLPSEKILYLVELGLVS